MDETVIYALNLSDRNHGRILSVTYDQYAPNWQPRIDHIPEGDCSDYLYENGEFVYDPLPKPEEDPEDEIPIEQKVADLEAAVLELAEILGGE